MMYPLLKSRTLSPKTLRPKLQNQWRYFREALFKYKNISTARGKSTMLPMSGDLSRPLSDFYTKMKSRKGRGVLGRIKSLMMVHDK